MTADDLLRGQLDAEKAPSKRAQAEDFLRTELGDRRPHDSAQVKSSAAAAGISDPTLQRARKSLCVIVVEQAGERGRTTTWALPPFGREGVLSPESPGPTNEMTATTAGAEGVVSSASPGATPETTPLPNPFLLSPNGAASAT